MGFTYTTIQEKKYICSNQLTSTKNVSHVTSDLLIKSHFDFPILKLSKCQIQVSIAIVLWNFSDKPVETIGKTLRRLDVEQTLSKKAQKIQMAGAT